ncbi:MAG: tripartite tricarboxylate transporter substrate binding protein [Woeseiaceae bacterium]|nr:tripartite tricarboxylate transporter substrate binding protein [Woeseiaceae bacterium]
MQSIAPKSGSQIPDPLQRSASRQAAVKILSLATIIVVAMFATPPAAADWPHDKPIKFIIPFGPGGFDTYVRTLAPVLEETLGAVVVPENVPGAGGRIGANRVYRAKPDGYTIGIWNMPGMSMPAVVGEKVRYDLNKLSWIAQVSFDNYALAVKADSPIKSFDQLCNLGRPATFAAQGGFTETASIAAVITMAELGCPYKLITGYQSSGQATLAVMRGDVDARINPLGSLLPYVNSGDVRLLLTFERHASVPGVPSIVELGHEEFVNFGLRRVVAGPPEMPDDIREKLSNAFLHAMQTERVQAWSLKSNNPFSPLGTAETAAQMDSVMRFYDSYGELLRKEFKGR